MTNSPPILPSALPWIARRSALRQGLLPAVVMFLIMSPFLALALLSEFRNDFGWTVFVGYLGIAVASALLVGTIEVWGSRRKWKRRVRTCGGRMCLECGHELLATSDEGACPKCTSPYTLASSQWGWTAWSGTLAEGPPPARPEPAVGMGTPPSVWRGVPRAMRQVAVFTMASTLGALAVAWAVKLILEHAFGVKEHIAVYGGLAIFMVMMLVECVYIMTRVSRLRRSATSHGYRLCLDCAYPVDDCEPIGRCPECGGGYSHASCEWGWRRLCKKTTAPVPPPRPS